MWDPSDALELENNENTSRSAQNGIHLATKNGFKLNAAREEEISEMIAIGNDSSIHNFADMSDDEDAEFNNFQFLMDNKITSK